MKRIGFLIGVLLLTLVSGSTARTVPLKVGTFADYFYYTYPGSNAARAMGRTDLLSEEPGSEWVNPSSPAVQGTTSGVTLYGTPFGLTYSDIDSRAASRYYSIRFHRSIFHLNRRPVTIGISAAHTRYTSGEYPEIVYGSFTGDTFRIKTRAYKVTAALATDPGIEIAGGVSLSWTEEEVADINADGWGYDIGLKLGLPLDRWLLPEPDRARLRVTGAMAWNNLGLSMDLGTALGEWDVPADRSMGVGLELATLDNQVPFAWRQVGLTAALTTFTRLDTGDSTHYRGGLELCLYETLKLRIGRYKPTTETLTTIGAEIDSDGLRMWLAGLNTDEAKARLIDRFSRRHLRLSMSYSRQVNDASSLDGGDSIGIVLRY